MSSNHMNTSIANSGKSSGILIAGIGNIFAGDDGFGVEVASRLARTPLRPEVTVVDFGIRGFDLACALVADWKLIILVDAFPDGGTAGTLYSMELESAPAPETCSAVEGHGLHPAAALQLAAQLGEITARILLVGCEPANFGGEEGRIGLSAPVGAAVSSAMDIIRHWIERDQDRTDEAHGGMPVAELKGER